MISMTIKRGAVSYPVALACVAIILAVLLAPVHTGYAATLVVPDNFKTIQSAVDAAMPNDTIVVKGTINKDGVYTENVTITKPLTLSGDAAKPTPTIKAATQSLSTLSILKTSDVIITGLTLVNSTNSGILVQNSSKVTLKDNISTKNTIGITVQHASEIILTNNQANFNENYGIYLDDVKRSKFENNYANSNNDKGFFVNNSHENVISGNNANLNTWNGITLYGSNKNVIKNNLTLRNTFGLVLGDSTEIEESGNTSMPNIYIIYPIILVYLGILSYLVQKNIFKAMTRKKA